MGNSEEANELLIHAPPQGGNKIIFGTDEGHLVTSVPPEDLMDLNALTYDKRTFTNSFADSILDLTDLEVQSAEIDGATTLETNYGNFKPIFDSSGLVYGLIGDAEIKIAEEQLKNSEKARMENQEAFALGESFNINNLDYSPEKIEFNPEGNRRLDYQGTVQHPSGRTLITFSDGEIMFRAAGTPEEFYQKQHSSEMNTDYHTTHSIISEFVEEFDPNISISLDIDPSQATSQPYHGQVQITEDSESVAYEADENTLSGMMYLADEIYIHEELTQDVDESLE